MIDNDFRSLKRIMKTDTLVNLSQRCSKNLDTTNKKKSKSPFTDDLLMAIHAFTLAVAGPPWEW